MITNLEPTNSMSHENFHSNTNKEGSRRKLVASLPGRIAATLFLIMAIIQISVAIGIVPISILWGGRFDELTPALSAAGVFAAGLLCLFAASVYQRSRHYAPNDGSQHDDLEAQRHPMVLRVFCWTITAYMVLNTVGNLMSYNTFERYAFGSLTTVLAICSGFVSSRSPVYTR